MNDTFVTRENIISEAFDRCMREMYANAQPPANYDDLVVLAIAGKEDEKNPFYTQHYLSQDEFKIIMDKYIDAYSLDTEFYEHCDTILNYFDNGIINKYVKKSEDNYGHKGYEKLKPLKELIGEDAYNIVVERVRQAQSFFRFNRDKDAFVFNVSLGCSPTSNKETVINYWKSQGIDIDIEDRDEDDIYCRYYENVVD